mmetsp:Transcript_14497/g.41212  ORF Transcript_14497/g.41212 Transcript_14497/m.41212 type:complete len:272 (-) Transcript_14497:630-1445(-)
MQLDRLDCHAVVEEAAVDDGAPLHVVADDARAPARDAVDQRECPDVLEGLPQSSGQALHLLVVLGADEIFGPAHRVVEQAHHVDALRQGHLRHSLEGAVEDVLHRRVGVFQLGGNRVPTAPGGGVEVDVEVRHRVVGRDVGARAREDGRQALRIASARASPGPPRSVDRLCSSLLVAESHPQLREASRIALAGTGAGPPPHAGLAGAAAHQRREQERARGGCGSDPGHDGRKRIYRTEPNKGKPNLPRFCPHSLPRDAKRCQTTACTGQAA